jgi:WXG100 family type VII secretion target
VADEATAGSDLRITPADVQALGRKAYWIASQLRSASATLNGEVQDLRATWRGIASDSYQTGWNELHTGASDAWTALFDLAAKLGVTADTFTETDATFASGMNFLELS